MTFVDLLFGLAALACFAGAFFITINPASKSAKEVYPKQWENRSSQENQSDSEEKFFTPVKEETN